MEDASAILIRHLYYVGVFACILFNQQANLFIKLKKSPFTFSPGIMVLKEVVRNN